MRYIKAKNQRLVKVGPVLIQRFTNPRETWIFCGRRRLWPIKGRGLYPTKAFRKT